MVFVAIDLAVCITVPEGKEDFLSRLIGAFLSFILRDEVETKVPLREFLEINRAALISVHRDKDILAEVDKLTHIGCAFGVAFN